MFLPHMAVISMFLFYSYFPIGPMFELFILLCNDIILVVLSCMCKALWMVYKCTLLYYYSIIILYHIIDDKITLLVGFSCT